MNITEEDVKALSTFINFVFTKATWQMNTKEAFDYVSLYKKATELLKKLDENVFELKQVIEKKDNKKDK